MYRYVAMTPLSGDQLPRAGLEMTHLRHSTVHFAVVHTTVLACHVLRLGAGGEATRSAGAASSSSKVDRK
jgi:hypothetical protein